MGVGQRKREMDNCVVCFVIMATTIMLFPVTSTVSISDSREPNYSFHIHLQNGFSDGHHIESNPGGNTSLQPRDFGLKEDERKLEEGELASISMDTRDMEALLSFRKMITSDPHGSLLDWTAENSKKVCSWTGIRCRKGTKRVVAIILPELQLKDLFWSIMDKLWKDLGRRIKHRGEVGCGRN